MSNKKITALIVAAGVGDRFGSTFPKQYLPLLGKPLLRWSIEAFRQHPLISEICVVINPDHAIWYRQAVEGLELPEPVSGGASRQESVLLGLQVLSATTDYVLIHDAARPCVSQDVITSVCQALETHQAVIPGLAVNDTIKRMTNGVLKTENREGLFAAQTPQGFHYKTILDLHRNAAGLTVTDDAALAEEAGMPVFLVEGGRSNIKVTHPQDLSLAEQHISQDRPDIRTGKGYDVHRLIPADGKVLKLCGIDVPHTHVLEGHSDADVALHAITDALLGTICDGDIGMHFSPRDMRWKGADSTQFLKHAASLVTAKGGIISHVDLTIICEMPKIGPRREQMRQKLAEILFLPLSRVSVKATTTEGLGFTGRGEGIAAEALATVRLPFTQETGVVAAPDIRKWGT